MISHRTLKVHIQIQKNQNVTMQEHQKEEFTLL